jgi:hypothetical protein
MCFSASASLAASGALAASSYAISRIPKHRSEKALSLIPAIFSVHQFIEGMLWLNHNGVIPDDYKVGAVYGYVFIAYALWPAYVPFAAYRIESERMRRRIILLCLWIGLYVGLTSLIGIFRYSVDVTVVGRSFCYAIQTPEMILAPYLISVSVPFLVSSDRKLVLFGGALCLSCAAAAYLAISMTFASVWCFFAAFLSGSLYLYFRTSSNAEVISQERMQEVALESG